MNEKITLTPEEMAHYKQQMLEYQRSRTLWDKIEGRWWYYKTMYQKARYHFRDWRRKFWKDIITVLTYQPGRGDGDGRWR